MVTTKGRTSTRSGGLDRRARCLRPKHHTERKRNHGCHAPFPLVLDIKPGRIPGLTPPNDRLPLQTLSPIQ